MAWELAQRALREVWQPVRPPLQVWREPVLRLAWLARRLRASQDLLQVEQPVPLVGLPRLGLPCLMQQTFRLPDQPPPASFRYPAAVMELEFYLARAFLLIRFPSFRCAGNDHF